MNLSDEELENELGGLQPRVPSQSLRESVEAQISRPARGSKKLIHIWPMVALASVACLALAAILSVSKSTVNDAGTPEANTRNPIDTLADYEAVEAEQRLVEAIDDGVVLTTEKEPVRMLRYRFIDSVTLVNHADGSVFTMEVPREEILFVPVSLL